MPQERLRPQGHKLGQGEDHSPVRDDLPDGVHPQDVADDDRPVAGEGRLRHLGAQDLHQDRKALRRSDEGHSHQGQDHGLGAGGGDDRNDHQGVRAHAAR